MADARRDGYSEPDPREDLRGLDLARKGVIAARTAGWSVDLDTSAVQGLCPEQLNAVATQEFLGRLDELDEVYQKSLTDILKKSQVPRCLVTASPEGCRVELEAVDPDNPFARLVGNEQLVEISTDIYHDAPLRIQGRGGGVEATAAGVLADMVELA